MKLKNTEKETGMKNIFIVVADDGAEEIFNAFELGLEMETAYTEDAIIAAVCAKKDWSPNQISEIK